MKEHETKELEQLIAKAMQKSIIETPSFQFTDTVMASIKAAQNGASVEYRPLVPRYIWVFIGVAIVGFTSYLWVLVEPAPLNWPTFDYNFSTILSKKITSFELSNITVYALLLFAAMICVQIPLLKRHFDTRNDY